ncbi:MAG: VOC family protein [Solirubrobacteraceae bacterium]
MDTPTGTSRPGPDHAGRPFAVGDPSAFAGSLTDSTVRDPEEAEMAGGPADAQISAATLPGAVHLSVSDLDRSLAFYRHVLGLRPCDASVTAHEGRDERPNDGAGERPDEGADGQRTCALGAGGGALVWLHEAPGAPRPQPGSTGLYHFALLVPERADLARWVAHIIRERIPLTGVADHFVSEAVYLSDPDGHGIEIYRDRPREAWEGLVAERMTTLPLNLESLLSELGEAPATAHFSGLASGTRMGHIHLKVAAIEPTVAFYRDVLGFALMASLGSSAAFLSAGGYHHHIGANTWESAGDSPPDHASAALRAATLELPGSGERERVLARLRAAGVPVQESGGQAAVRDPSGNRLLLAAAGGPTARLVETGHQQGTRPEER